MIDPLTINGFLKGGKTTKPNKVVSSPIDVESINNYNLLPDENVDIKILGGHENEIIGLHYDNTATTKEKHWKFNDL